MVKNRSKEEKALVAKKPELATLMASKYNLDREKFLETIRGTVMRPGKDGRVATNEEVTAFLIVANKYNLDPFTNEIYAFPAKKGGIIPIVGVDGQISHMLADPEYNGHELEESEEEITMEGAKQCPKWMEIKIYKKNIDHPTVVREYLDETYVPVRSGFSGPWQTHTKRMLRHKTIIQGIRLAFPLAGVYDPDEGQRILEAEIVEELPGKPNVKMPEEITDQSDKKVEKPEEEKKQTPMDIKIHSFKRTLKEITGNDEIYYRACGSFGAEHMTEMDITTKAKFATELVAQAKVQSQIKTNRKNG